MHFPVLDIDTPFVICWMRRDIRLDDHASLYHALKSGYPVLPIFIFDDHILSELPKYDRRVDFIYQAIDAIQNYLVKQGRSMAVFHGTPEEVFKHLSEKYPLKAVFTNHDYEPYAISRDKRIGELLHNKNINFTTYKDQVIFEKGEVLTGEQKPYTVFTPYSKKWKATLNEFYLKPYPTNKYKDHFIKHNPIPILDLATMGFEKTDIVFSKPSVDTDLIRKYHDQRDFPAIQGTSRLSMHIRFGTISIRKLANIARQTNETWLNELIWRDFYHMILSFFPHIVDKAFKSAYDQIPWRDSEQDFERWKNGQTGYPIVDAGMRELNETGFMHNRVRMITASFLTKHLLIDWRKGEAYFAEKLNDFDLASNNGGWQWASSSGCDAAPYFRIFNPALQTKRFDPQLKYIKKWVPELTKGNYPLPMVNHEFARKRALETYSESLNSQKNK